MKHERGDVMGSKIGHLRTAGTGFAASSAITAVFAAGLLQAGIPLNVVLPTSAPVWMGFGTTLFMVLKD
ncbi:MAG: hypothetical protein HY362_04900 [Candidatus Aenigmarchaeota archaeon]|nr:hypothetical protein [Candidatus Aenigmarchaeota archaeon]